MRYTVPKEYKPCITTGKECLSCDLETDYFVVTSPKDYYL